MTKFRKYFRGLDQKMIKLFNNFDMKRACHKFFVALHANISGVLQDNL